jgi:integrase
MTLTTAAIKAAQPGAILRDDRIRGLHVRISPQAKAFYLYFRTRSGLERRPKIGDYPVITLERAREIATEWLRVVAGGGDPVAGWKQDREAPTVEDLADKYRKKHAAKKKSKAEDERILDNYVTPRLGKKRVQDVGRADIEALHEAYEETPYQANRVLALCSKMFALAEKWEMRPHNSNPCHGIARFKEQKRRRYMRPGEAKLVFDALTKHRSAYPQSAAFLLLLMFTGARPSEIASARWSDYHGNRIELTAHKTDQDGAPRVIFLPPQAVEVIEALPRTGGAIVGIQSPRRLWRLIVKETGLTDLRMYDLRHSFASAGLASDMTLGQIGELLGHRSTQTTHRYAHLMEERGVAQATRAADFLERMVAGPGTAPEEAGNAGRRGTFSSPRPTQEEPAVPATEPPAS